MLITHQFCIGLVGLVLDSVQGNQRNRIAPPPTQEMFHYISELHSYGTRSASSGNFQLKSVRLTVGKSAISYIGSKIWNDIEN